MEQKKKIEIEILKYNTSGKKNSGKTDKKIDTRE